MILILILKTDWTDKAIFWQQCVFLAIYNLKKTSGKCSREQEKLLIIWNELVMLHQSIFVSLLALVVLLHYVLIALYGYSHVTDSDQVVADLPLSFVIVFCRSRLRNLFSAKWVAVCSNRWRRDNSSLLYSFWKHFYLKLWHTLTQAQQDLTGPSFIMISLIGVVYDANVENNLRHGYVCIRIERISIVNIMRIFSPCVCG